MGSASLKKQTLPVDEPDDPTRIELEGEQSSGFLLIVPHQSDCHCPSSHGPTPGGCDNIETSTARIQGISQHTATQLLHTSLI